MKICTTILIHLQWAFKLLFSSLYETFVFPFISTQVCPESTKKVCLTESEWKSCDWCLGITRRRYITFQRKIQKTLRVRWLISIPTQFWNLHDKEQATSCVHSFLIFPTITWSFLSKRGRKAWKNPDRDDRNSIPKHDIFSSCVATRCPENQTWKAPATDCYQPFHYSADAVMKEPPAPASEEYPGQHEQLSPSTHSPFS